MRVRVEQFFHWTSECSSFPTGQDRVKKGPLPGHRLQALQESAFPGHDAAAFRAFRFKAGHAALMRLRVPAGQADTRAPGPAAEAGASAAAAPAAATLAATLAAAWTSLLRKNGHVRSFLAIVRFLEAMILSYHQTLNFFLVFHNSSELRARAARQDGGRDARPTSLFMVLREPSAHELLP